MLRPEDVIPHLGKPYHWADGRSAKLIAKSWFEANALPIMVEHTLRQTARFSSVELIEACLEKCIDLRDGRKPSQADVLAILGIGDELALMAVEGKVDESFGLLVSEWLVNASTGKLGRLQNLCRTLDIGSQDVGHLRYQLLHRTASAIYEAKRYRARTAVMMVHSFDPADAGVSDFRLFASALGLPDAGATKIAGPIARENVDLYLGWTADRASNEGFTIVNGRKTDAGFFDEA